MNLLNIETLSKSYTERRLIDRTDFSLQEGEKVGVVGMNGTGKSTLLKILAGLEEPDDGKITMANHVVLRYLPQHPVFDREKSSLDCVLEGNVTEENRWSVESDAKAMMTRLGITDFSQPAGQLSGGQKKKLALVSVLLSSADILLLDEPTNHLDNTMMNWLEDYLRKWKGSLIMVTHDRYFLDRVSNRILEIDHGKFYSYESNYSGFLEKKAQREEMEQASERKRQSILRMEMEWAKRGCRARTTKQKARLERLEALKQGKAPVMDARVELDSVETRMGKKTVELYNVSKHYGEKTLIDDFTYIVLRNQRLGIVGPNGCGKSTLLKIIAGILEPDAGHVELGDTVRMGYFSQELPQMDTRQRVIDYIKDIGEYVPTKDGRITACQMLERFLFTPDMQYSPIAKLSGGEKKRLYLLSILIAAPNCLILDEITNDLDIPTLTILEDYLDSFSGIVITVSHDRYFLDNVVDRIFAFEGNGRLRQYEGGYTDYLEAVQQEQGAEEIVVGRASRAPEKKNTEKDWKKNVPTKMKFTYKEQKEFEVIDEEIAALEAKIQALDEEMAACASQYTRLTELAREKEEAEQAMDEKMERWMYLNELHEKILAQ